MALKWLRDQLKYLQWVLYIIVFAFIITLFFDYGTIQPGAFADDDVAAMVGPEEITYADYRREVRNTEDRYRQAFGSQWTADMSERFNLSQVALNQLVDRRIMLLEARRMGLRVTEDEVQAAIVEAFSDADGFIGRERVQQILRSQRLPEKVFTELMRDDVLLQKLNDVLRQTAYISAEEVQQTYRDEVDQAKIRYVSLQATTIENAPSVTDAELQAYYDETSVRYELPEQRIVDYLLVDRGKLRAQVEVPEEELRAYYQDNQAEFTREEQVSARHILVAKQPGVDAEAKARELKARIEAGEDFGAVARESSDDEGSAQRGGALGYFGRGKMVAPFEEAAFGAEKGEIVGPVESDFGYHVIEVLDHRDGGLRPFEEVERLINSRLVGEQVEEIAEQKARELEARISSESLETREQLQALADEEEFLSLTTTEPFGRNDVIPGVGRAPEVMETAFSLEAGAISEPVKLPRGWAILRLDAVNPPRVPALEEVRDEVQREVETRKRKEMAVERLAAARERIEGGETFEAVAGDLGLEITTSELFNRLGTIAGLGRSRPVVDAALSLPEGQLSEPIETADGAVLFEVLERQEGDEAGLEERREELRGQLASERLDQILRALIQQRRLELSPQYDAKLARELGLQQAAT